MNATKRAQVPFGLRKKLMAATSMLLVAAIMLVSTSYAWFTLSTAPEITGITTSVGANGNLEIALLNGLTYANTEEISSKSGDSMATKAVAEANITWGNLVDLSDGSYGLNLISLYPSALNADGGVIGAAPLSVPEYGSDGRVSVLSPNTTTGVFDVGQAAFSADPSINEYGVRAVGTADNVSAREMIFKSAKSAFTSKVANAKSATQNKVGSKYDIFISMAAGTDTYTPTQVSAMKEIAEGVQTSLNSIVSAYANAGLVKAASTASINDEAVGLLSTALTGKTDAGELMTLLGNYGVTTFNTELDALNTQQEAVEKAIAVANALLAVANGNESYEYGTTPFSYPTGEGVTPTYTGTEAGAVEDEIAKPLLGGSANIKLYDGNGGEMAKPGAGTDVFTFAKTVKAIYLDGGAMGAVATYTGVFKAATVDVSAMGINLTINVGEKGSTTNKLAAVKTQVDAMKVVGATNEAINLTTYYGYVIDFAVRTNAAGSSLKLQTEAVNRVYDNAEGENLATQGSGSTVEFVYTDGSGMTHDKASKLLDAMRAVFFNPENGQILKYAKFTDATAGTNKTTAELRLHDVVEAEVTKSTLGKDAFVPVYYLDTEAYPAANGTVQYTNYPGEPTVALTAAQYNAISDLATTSTTTGEGENAVTTYTLGKDAYYAAYQINSEFKVSVPGVDGAPATEAVPSAGNCWNYPENEKKEISALEYKYLEAVTASLTKKEVSFTEATGEGAEVIMPLTQNQAHKISVLVYMDGENIDNAAVGYGESSGTLNMNLQFSSTADLIPMENSALRTMEKQD